MFRTALTAFAAIAAIAVASSAAAQSASPVRTFNQNAKWEVVKAGQTAVSHCMMGVRSDASAPQAGKPQFMITADNDFAILRVRAAEWKFDGARSIAVTLATANGGERQPDAFVRGQDLIDIAFGAESERLNELAAAGHIDIKTEGTTVRLSLAGLADVLPAFRDCLANIGKPADGRQMHASIAK